MRGLRTTPIPGQKVGIYPGVSLAEARKKATLLRQKTNSGISPIEEAREKDEAERHEALKKQIELERPQTIEELFF